MNARAHQWYWPSQANTEMIFVQIRGIALVGEGIITAFQK
jgi:hypothetical protein